MSLGHVGVDRSGFMVGKKEPALMMLMTAHSGDVLKGCCHVEWMMVIPKHPAHVIQSDQPKSGHSQETFYFNQMPINQ